MANVNPTRLKWKAPTEDEAGNPIDYELDYEVGIEDNGVFVPVMVVVGSLRPDDWYEAPLSQLALDDGVYTLAMRALRRDAEGVMSDWSVPVVFEVEFDRPKPPFGLAVE